MDKLNEMGWEQIGNLLYNKKQIIIDSLVVGERVEHTVLPAISNNQSDVDGNDNRDLSGSF